MVQHQEILESTFDQNPLDLIFNYFKVYETNHSRLLLEALKYLAALLSHTKFAIEFIQSQGVHRLVEVPLESIAAIGVAKCLHQIANCEDAMEKVCLLEDFIIQQLIRYALNLLECPYKSGRCYAVMFLGDSFQYRIMLEQFDGQDGFRRIYNMIRNLPILSMENPCEFADDPTFFFYRVLLEHVFAAFTLYFETHLAVKVEDLLRIQVCKISVSPQSSLPPYKAIKLNYDQIQDLIATAQELLPFEESWPPVDLFVDLGGIRLLLLVTGIYLWRTPKEESILPSIVSAWVWNLLRC